jgi:hypothetical protein
MGRFFLLQLVSICGLGLAFGLGLALGLFIWGFGRALDYDTDLEMLLNV